MNARALRICIAIMVLSPFFAYTKEYAKNSQNKDNTTINNIIVSNLNIKNAPYAVKIKDRMYSNNLKADEKMLIGSLTKTFTATLIFHLQKQHLLSIDDNVNKYIKKYKIKDGIKIKHLLSHTSGIRDGGDEDTFLMVYEYQNTHFTNHDFIKYSKFTNDFEFSYSNTNYILLGEIIEQVSGLKFHEYLQKVIIDKLNLKNTCVPIHQKNCNPKKGYLNLALFGKDKKIIQFKDYTGFVTFSYSAGNLASSINDLDAFFVALTSNVFFDFNKMKVGFNKMGANASDAGDSYGYGIIKYKKDIYGHSGQTLDTRSIVQINIKNKNSIIALVGDSSITNIDTIYNKTPKN
jgi:CubicO group peptidase (beta-lactamase class C family)